MEGREQSCIGYMELAGVIIEVAGSPAGGAAAAVPAAGLRLRRPDSSHPAAQEDRGEVGGVAEAAGP